MKPKIKLSRLMKLSWKIQKAKSCSRSKALFSAWAILNNEDLTILYLSLKFNGDNAIPAKSLNQISLFNF